MFKSLLFIPANNEKLLNKAEKSEADTIIFDLEDSVLESEKSNARNLLFDFLQSFENKDEKKIIVRINQTNTVGQDDIQKLGSIKSVDAFMLPKADEKNIVTLEKWLDKTEMEHNVENGTFGIFPLIETPGSILNIQAITQASKRIIGMLFGAEDFTTFMGIQRTIEGDEIFVARNLFAMACSAAGIEAIDTPCTEIKDRELIELDARNGKRIGMTGKAAIHPVQVPIINEIFHPNEEELRTAREIVDASEAALKEGKGAFSVSGKMIDLPIVERAMKVINAAENIDRNNSK